jgi:hypothetical protein
VLLSELKESRPPGTDTQNLSRENRTFHYCRVIAAMLSFESLSHLWHGRPVPAFYGVVSPVLSLAKKYDVLSTRLLDDIATGNCPHRSSPGDGVRKNLGENLYL